MFAKTLIAASLLLVVCAGGLVGCKGKKTAATVDPHSPEGIMHAMQQQGQLLNDALARKDFAYIHDYAYYFNGLTQTLFNKLDDAQKAQLRGTLGQLSTLSSQLDRAAGGHHPEATEATLQRLTAELKELDKQFRGGKKSS